MTAAIPYIIMAGGYAMQQRAQGDADKKQQRILARAETIQNGLTGNALGITENSAKKYDATARADAANQAEQTAATSLGQALTEAQTKIAPDASGNVSDAYTVAKAKSAADTLARGQQLAQLMAKMRAPLDLRANEGFDNANASSQSAMLQGDARRTMDYAQRRIGRVKPNQGQMMLGGLMQSFGSGMSGGSKSTPSYTSPMGKPPGSR